MAKYKHTKVTTDEVLLEGILDVAAMTVDVDGEKISLADELKIYDGKSFSATFVEKIEEEI